MVFQDWQGFRRLAQMGIVLLAGAAIHVGIQKDWTGTAILILFLALSIFVVTRRNQLPRLFETLFVVAAVVNAAGYVWQLFDSTRWFDEIAHFYTGFAVTLALGFLLYGNLVAAFRPHRAMLVVTITAMGIAIGAVWEIVEWLIEVMFNVPMISSLHDTITDLVLDTAGAFLAALVNLAGLNES